MKPCEEESFILITKTATHFFITGGHPPPDSIIEVVVPRVISLSLFITMTVLSSVGIVLTCIFLGFNIKYRQSK